jgi:hypothetical protein
VKKIKVAVALLLSLVGAITLVFNMNRAVLICASQSWPSVEGEIVVSENVNDVARRQSKYGTRPLRISKSDISYVYVVERKRFVGTTVAFYQKDSPRSITEKYSVGKSVRVFFDQNNPERAVLEISSVLDLWWAFAFGTIAVVVGVAGAVRANRKRA